MATQEHNYNPSHTNERNETVKRYDDHPSYRYSSHMDGIAGHHTKIHHKTTDGLTGALSAERFYLCWDNQPMKCVAVRGFLAHLHAVKAASASAPSQSSVSPLVHCTEWQRPAGAEAYLVLDCPIPTLQRGPPHNDVARRHQAFLTAIKQYFESHDAISAGLRAVDDPHYYVSFSTICGSTLLIHSW